MKKSISKTEAKENISKSFKEIKSKTPKEIKKIKILAMSHNILLKEKRKLFCKKCLTPYKNAKIRIKKGMKSVECGNCGRVSRWELK